MKPTLSNTSLKYHSCGRQNPHICWSDDATCIIHPVSERLLDCESKFSVGNKTYRNRMRRGRGNGASADEIFTSSTSKRVNVRRQIVKMNIKG